MYLLLFILAALIIYFIYDSCTMYEGIALLNNPSPNTSFEGSNPPPPPPPSNPPPPPSNPPPPPPSNPPPPPSNPPPPPSNPPPPPTPPPSNPSYGGSANCPRGCATKIGDADCILKLANTAKAFYDCGQSCWSPQNSPLSYCQFDEECVKCPRSRVPLGECSPYRTRESCYKHASCEWKNNFCVIKVPSPPPAGPPSGPAHPNYFNEEKNKFIFNEYVGADLGDLAEFEIVEKTPKSEVFQDVIIAPGNAKEINIPQ